MWIKTSSEICETVVSMFLCGVEWMDVLSASALGMWDANVLPVHVKCHICVGVMRSCICNGFKRDKTRIFQ